MNPFEPYDYEPNEERIEWIRKLAKGDGLRSETKGVPYGLFLADSWEGVCSTIRTALAAVPGDTPAGVAIRRALNVDFGESKSLVERRASAAKALGVTERTVDRFELAGARAVDQEIDYWGTGYTYYRLLRINSAFAAVASREGFSQETVARLEEAVEAIGIEWAEILKRK